LTRGDDMLDPVKTTRLDKERDLLFRKFPRFAGRDPFYSPNLDASDPHFQLRMGSRAFVECTPFDLAGPADGAVAQCAIDAINGKPVAGTIVVPRGSAVSFAGWAGDDHGLPAGAIEIILKCDQRSYRAATVTGISRPDVAAALDCEAMATSGYLLATSLEDVEPGDYALYMVRGNDSGAACELAPRLVVQ